MLSSLRRKLLWLLAARAVVVTVLLGSGVLIQSRSPETQPIDTVAFFAVIVYGSIDPLAHAWGSGEYEGEGALRIPTWPARFVVLLGSALAAFNYFLGVLQHARSFLGRKT